MKKIVLSLLACGLLFSVHINASESLTTIGPSRSFNSYQFENLKFNEGSGQHYFSLEYAKGPIVGCDYREGCGSTGLVYKGKGGPSFSFNFDVSYATGNECKSVFDNYINRNLVTYIEGSNNLESKKQYISSKNISWTIISLKGTSAYYAFASYQNYLYRITMSYGSYDQEKNSNFNYFDFFTKQLDYISIDKTKIINQPYKNIVFDREGTLNFRNIIAGKYASSLSNNGITLVDNYSNYYFISQLNFVSPVKNKKVSYCMEYDLINGGANIYMSNRLMGTYSLVTSGQLNEMGGDVSFFEYGSDSKSIQSIKTGEFNQDRPYVKYVKTKNNTVGMIYQSCSYWSHHTQISSCREYTNVFVRASYKPGYYQTFTLGQSNLGQSNLTQKWSNFVLYGL